MFSTRAQPGLLAGYLLVLLGTTAAAIAAPGAEAATEPPIYYSTATVQSRPLSSATAAVEVIEGWKIEASGARTAAEALRLAPGVWLVDPGTRGGFATLQIRGGDPNFTLVLLDGVPLNDPNDPVGGAFNLESLPVTAVERIEVVRGPLSQRYGSAALAGVVNIITRSGSPEAGTTSILTETGDASLLRSSLLWSGGLGPAASTIAVSWEEEDRRIAEERFEQLNLHWNLSASLGEHRELSLRARVSEWEALDYPEASGGPLFGSRELRASDNLEATLLAELVRQRGGPGAVERWSAAVAVHELDRDSPAIAPLVPASRESSELVRGRLGWLRELPLGEGTRLGIGADVELEDGTSDSRLRLAPVPGGELRGGYAINRRTAGIFSELVVERGWWVFESSARLDLPEGFGPELNPRLGASYRPDGGPLRLFGSVGRGFKLPSFFALASPPQLGGNPDLVPESAWGADLGLERRFAGSGSRASLTFFYQRYRDLVDFDFASFRHVNRSRVESWGAELSLRYALRTAWTLEADLTWNRTRSSADEPLRHRPEWTGNARLRWRGGDGYGLWLELQSASESFDRQIPVPTRDTVAGWQRFALAGDWRLSARWQLRARIDNLLDRSFEQLIGFPAAERSLRIGLRWSQATGPSTEQMSAGASGGDPPATD